MRYFYLCRLYCFFAILAFLTLAPNASAQKTDSLKQALHAPSTPDTVKVTLSAKLAWIYQEINVDSAIIFANSGLQMAKKQGFQKGIGDCLQQLGLASMKRNEPQKALQYYGDALNAYETARYDYGRASAILSMADIYYREANYDKALEYYQSGKAISERAGDLKHKGNALLSMGGLYSDLSNYSEALKYYLDALSVFEKSKDLSGTSMALTNIATVYSAQGDYKKALEYVSRGVELAQRTGNTEGLLFNVVNTGIVYAQMKDYKSALQYFKDALALADSIDDMNWKLMCMNNVAEAYYYLNLKDEALKYYSDVLQLAEKIDDAILIVSIHSGIGNILVEKGKIADGIKHLEKAYALAREKNMKESIFKRAQELSGAYEKMNDALKSLKYHKVYAAYKDSVYNDNSNKQIQQLHYEYELGKKENRIQLLEKNKLIEKAKAEKQNVVMWALIAGVLLLIITIVVLYRSRMHAVRSKEVILRQKEEIQEQAKRLEGLNQFKDKTFSVLSHDLRNPISSFTTTMMLLDDNIISARDFVKLRPALNRQLNSLNGLLDSLLKWAGSYIHGLTPAKVEQVDICGIMRQNISLLQEEADKKNQTIIGNLPDTINALCDAGQMDIVIRNLITNALKFTGNNGAITLSAKSYETEVKFSVADSGVGMSQEQIGKLFVPVDDRNTPGTEGEKGLGLGLLLCYEFIKANKGDISVSSELGKGSTFTVTLPKA
jgi:signal transduction histidine kinase